MKPLPISQPRHETVLDAARRSKNQPEQKSRFKNVLDAGLTVMKRKDQK